jgi:2-polyprenyl-3-methyl-5-hydroxy-6-metoxy-1,4-benzoquinol methylase
MRSVTGKYNKDQQKYGKLINKVYEDYSGGVTLSPEYAYFVQNDMMQFFIRLARYKFVARMLKKTDRVLDVGCGSGLGSIFISQYCNFVYGIDIKSTEINDAKRINHRNNLEFGCQDLYEVEKNKHFDVVVAIDVIEHYPVIKGINLIKEMSKHLNQNGILLIGTPSKYSYPYQGKLSQASHIHCYDQQELVNQVGKYFGRTFAYSMNDELVHTGFSKLAWYYFVIAVNPYK